MIGWNGIDPDEKFTTWAEAHRENVALHAGKPGGRFGCPLCLRERADGGKVERVAIDAATQATRRAPVESDLAEVWCSRCEQAAVMYVGRNVVEYVCAEHALRAAAERIVAIEGSEYFSSAMTEALADLEEALALAPVPVSNPSPDVIERARLAGAYAL